MKTTLPYGEPETGFGGNLQLDESRLLRPDELPEFAFFEGLEKQELERIAEYAKYTHFEAGDEILTQGDAADRFYVILSGRVRLTCNLPDVRLTVKELGPGDVVGFSWLFTPEKVHFNAYALEPVKAVFIYGTLLRTQFQDAPGLGYKLAVKTGRAMLERFEAVIDMIGGAPFVED